ncbi:MAG: nucleotidyltransferase domain-containing protein [Candidatus Eremiobacteraeota bacterium]|nr:nucleotidyltransferase domain-containing protein [Candidatus Eremiobacteraeota bacterium]
MNGKVKNILSGIEAEAKRIFGNKLVEIILFGSYARDTQESHSDLDIMVIIDEDEENIRKYEDRFTDISFDISLEHDIVPSIILKSRGQFIDYKDVLPFYMNVRNEGVKVYGRKAS